MAVPKNQVSVTGAINPFEGVSSAFGNLSKTLLDEAAREEEAARQAALQAENTRRYEADRARTQRLDEIAAADRTRRISREDILRAREDDTYAKQLAVTAAREEANRLASGFDQNDYKFGLSDYNRAQQAEFNRRRSVLDRNKGLTRSFLEAPSEENLKTIITSYKDTLASRGYDKAQINNLAEQRRLQLLSAGDELGSAGYESGQKGKRIDSLLGSLYDQDYKTLDDTITSGKLLSKENLLKSVIGRMPENIRKYVDADTLYKTFGERVYNLSRGDLNASEQARIDALNKTQEKRIGFAKDYYSLLDSPTRSYSKDAKGVATAIKDMSGIDIGWRDNKKVREGFEYFIRNDIPPHVAAAATQYGIEKGLIDDTFPAVGSPKFTTLLEVARDFAGVSSGKYSSKVLPKRSEFTYNPVIPKTLEQLQTEAIRRIQLGRGSIAPSPLYDRSVINRLPPVPEDDAASLAQPATGAGPVAVPAEGTLFEDIPGPNALLTREQETANTLSQAYPKLSDSKVNELADLVYSDPKNEEVSKLAGELGINPAPLFSLIMKERKNKSIANRQDWEKIGREVLRTVEALPVGAPLTLSARTVPLTRSMLNPKNYIRRAPAPAARTAVRPPPELTRPDLGSFVGPRNPSARFNPPARPKTPFDRAELARLQERLNRIPLVEVPL